MDVTVTPRVISGFFISHITCKTRPTLLWDSRVQAENIGFLNFSNHMFVLLFLSLLLFLLQVWLYSKHNQLNEKLSGYLEVGFSHGPSFCLVPRVVAAVVVVHIPAREES